MSSTLSKLLGATLAIALAGLVGGCPTQPEPTNMAPALVPPANATVEVGDTFSIVLQAMDPDGDAITYGLLTYPAGAVLDDDTLTWTPVSANVGSHAFIVSATDDGDPPLVDYASFTVTVEDPLLPMDNHPPMVTPEPDQSVAADQFLAFVLDAVDPDGDTLTWEALVLPAGSALDTNTATFTWTPTTADGGAHYALFQVTDDGAPPLSARVLVRIDVFVPGAGNMPPSFFGVPAPGLVSVCEPFFAVFEAVDPDGDAVTYISPNLPPGATLTTDGTTGALTWEPAATDAGTYYINIYAVDDGEPTMADSILYVVDVVDIPWINPIAPLTVVGGDLATTETVVWGNSCTNVTVTGLPSGAVWDPGEGVIAWQTAPEDFGIYFVSFTVENNETPPVTATETARIVVQLHIDFSDLLAFSFHQVHLDFCCQGPVTWTPEMDPVWNEIMHSDSALGVDVQGHAYLPLNLNGVPLAAIAYELTGWDVVVGPACGSGGQLRVLDFPVTDPAATWPDWSTVPPSAGVASLPDGTAGTIIESVTFAAPATGITLDLVHADSSNICTVDAYWADLLLTPLDVAP